MHKMDGYTCEKDQVGCLALCFWHLYNNRSLYSTSTQATFQHYSSLCRDAALTEGAKPKTDSASTSGERVSVVLPHLEKTPKQHIFQGWTHPIGELISFVVRLPQRRQRPTSSAMRSSTLKGQKKATVGRTGTPGSSVTNSMSGFLPTATCVLVAFVSQRPVVLSLCSRDVHCGYLLCSNISPAPRLGELQGGLTSFSVARHSASLDCRYGRKVQRQAERRFVAYWSKCPMRVYCPAELTCWSMETLISATLRTGRPAGQTKSVSITNASPCSSSTSAPAPAPLTRPSALDTGWTHTHMHIVYCCTVGGCQVCYFFV